MSWDWQAVVGFQSTTYYVTTASGQDRYTNSQKASYITHSAIVYYPAIYVHYILSEAVSL
jgi:hypothetical protein